VPQMVGNRASGRFTECDGQFLRRMAVETSAM